MEQSDKQFSKWRWLLALVGLFMYLGDICTDTALVLRYFHEKLYVWSGLTALFIITGLTVNQIFSYAWFLEDMHKNVMDSKPKRRYLVLHIFGMGILLRSCQLLKQGYKEIWGQEMPHNQTSENGDEEGSSASHHSKLFSDTADLSMLKLFETFLESAPQLLLQLYIHQNHEEWSVLQSISMVFSFFNLAWSLVDYRICLRKSLPQSRELPSGLPTAVYLLYKLFTITSLILSYSLLLILSVYSTVGFTSLWLLGTIRAHRLETSFCSSGALELLYRGVIGAILVFTFFNVKGQGTKRDMTVYYFFWTVINFSTPLLMFFLKPELKTITFLLVVSGVIYGGSLLGLILLVLYYRFLHPKQEAKKLSDQVDGQENMNGQENVDGQEKETTPSTRRTREFIKP
ncbi:XK-related protein 9 [Poecilia reticulata]|uniref:XK-related protein n=1 Tax=Poecilia reticulata TaxID=8081 RepID=A0A3P9PYE4_POERE|nr:PREDICTED: XK-related protein 9 [Poecilia reticulata]XP_017157491.1 PREDICTED: XK-related protein 9 [Poecilia reticulata]